MTTPRSKALNISLWTAQGLLAVMFGMIGAMKTFSPIGELAAAGMTWAADVPALARFIGLSELLGGISLILPALLRIKPFLTVWAATGLALIMALAVIFHLCLHDAAHAGMPLVLGSIAAFIAWGRSKKVPVQPRS